MTDAGRLLLVRRALEPWLGAWCGPAGFCDADEHPIVTAEREALEEAGLHVRVTGFLGIWTGPYGSPAPGGEQEWVSVAWYHARPLEEPAVAFDPAETSEVGWFGPDEIPAELAPPWFPEIVEAWRAALEEGRLETPLPDRPR